MDSIESNEIVIDTEVGVEESTMSETIGKLAGALAKAQGDMTMVEAKSNNPFFNKAERQWYCISARK